jgi:transposase
MKKHIITQEEYETVKETAAKNKLKRVDKRLQVILLRYEGLKDKEIAEKLDYSGKRVSQLCAEFKAVGAEKFARHKYGGNHRNLSNEEETEFLENFKEQAESGQIVEVSEIKAAYEQKLGRELKSKGHIYSILARHGWRKVMPRSKHPNKASDEEMESSKKLKIPSETNRVM